MILLDGSSSVGNDNFLKVKTWVKGVARRMEIEKGHVQIGVVCSLLSRDLFNSIFCTTTVAFQQVC